MSVLSELAEAVRSAFAARIGDSSGVEVEAVLNWGGFVNRSFRITTPTGQYHLKLASDAAVKSQLRQWWSLRELLEQRYRAPRTLAWMDIEGSGYSGLLFDRIHGEVPDAWSAHMLQIMSDLLDRLHNDPDLGVELRQTGARAFSCADVYSATFHRRFVEDLRGITTARPSFISESRLDWMQEEVRAIEVQVNGSGVFDELASSPTHGDLWLNNVLVTGARHLYLLDWDDLGLGDPAMDWAMLYGPTRSDPRPVMLRRPNLDAVLDVLAVKRLPIWGRATLLDWIIDPVADWVEAEAEPEHGSTIRTSAEIVHERALNQYLALWG